jgi:glycerate 2-kinase
VAGVCSLDAAVLSRAGVAAAYSLADIEPDVQASMANAGPLLEKLAHQIAADWLQPPG